MQNIIDFSDFKYSNRHGYYGGHAGDKDGILYNSEYWIIKYPKSTRSLKNINDLSYVTSPLSEYIGSHIYDILGYDVHKTLLGIRNNKVVVACKDFCPYRNDIMEMRTIKNAANAELSKYVDEELENSSSGDRVNLDELFLHFEHNPILQRVDGIIERFWDTVVVDIFIGNNDRNNGNWGLIPDEQLGFLKLAPIYDNGNSFNTKTPDYKIEEYYRLNRVDEVACGNRTAYDYNGHTLSAKKMLKLNNEDLSYALDRVVPNIIDKKEIIYSFISDIPENYHEYQIISPIRKRFYIDTLESRIQNMLLPAYSKSMKNEEEGYKNINSSEKMKEIEEIEKNRNPWGLGL